MTDEEKKEAKRNEDALFNWPSFFKALAEVETGDNVKDGAAGEKGPLQITQIMVDDLNRIIGRERWTHEDALDPSKANRMCMDYVKYYSKDCKKNHPSVFMDLHVCIIAALIWRHGPVSSWPEKVDSDYAERLFNLYKVNVEEVLSAALKAKRNSDKRDEEAKKNASEAPKKGGMSENQLKKEAAAKARQEAAAEVEAGPAEEAEKPKKKTKSTK